MKKKAKAKSQGKKKSSALSNLENLPPLPDHRAMEGVMSSIFGGGKRNAVDEAQEIMYEAWEAPTRRRAVDLARKALEVSADCADAYNLLAEETAESLEEVIDFYRKGVEAGERALGKEEFEESVGHFWGLTETRPYMRARAGLAQSLWEAGQREEAVDHYSDLLRLNPNDNQGIRALLMPCLIELGRDEDAEKLFKQYDGDCTAFWMYSRALLDFRMHGDSAIADKSLKAALGENQHVPPYLLGRKKLPRTLPGHYGFGDDNEAVLYVHENWAVWKATPGAMKWLAAKVK
ncbi:MAG: tetratricopeptide repeat protein [candidate division Zixibacteria bacterium]|nr:tetratricopeptide repeat protein [candidate division Zixibacteria bacterium]MBU2624111.1 tetratricopeptide repeat protein [candidate division Zixibacteria bacterium]